MSDLDQGHFYECPCLPYFHGSNLKINIFLGFKAVCKAGPVELHKIYSASKSYGDFRHNGGFDPVTKKYDGNSYLAVLNLISHVEHNEKFPQLIQQAISFTEILRSKTNFFDQIQDKKNLDEFKDFVASIALYHAQSVPFNCLGLSDTKFELQPTSAKSDNNLFGNLCEPDVCKIGIYPLTSLFNHSCDPNVGRANLTDGRLVIMATKDLKVGDELFMSYGYEFTTNDLEDRQENLAASYLFNCECIACENNWPLYNNLEEFPIRLRCPKCTRRFSYYEFEKCVLDEIGDFDARCRNCKKVFDLRVLWGEIKHFPSRLSQSMKCYKCYSELIPVLINYCRFLQSRVCPPFLPLYETQEVLKSIYFELAHENE